MLVGRRTRCASSPVTRQSFPARPPMMAQAGTRSENSTLHPHRRSNANLAVNAEKRPVCASL